MSYTRSYSRTVSASYSKTVTLSYPASQSGGTTNKTVTGTVEIPVHIDIHVDTNRFDRDARDCRGSVDMLNAAVIATTAEEIAAKKAASLKIGSAIVGGFFNYIGAELSQKSKELSSKCEALLIELMEQKVDCERKSEQMGGDYHRISGRYSKVFEDLNSELYNRIRAIDKSIFEVSGNLLACSSRSSGSEQLGVATIASDENARLDATITASAIKNRAQVLLSKTKAFLHGGYVLQYSLSEMLYDGNSGGEIAVPVIYEESTGESGAISRKVYGCDALPLTKCGGVENILERKFQNSSTRWKAISQSEDVELDAYFNSELESAELDPRVQKMMLQLKNNNKLNVITL